MTEKPALTREQILALAAKHTKPATVAITPTEVLQPAPASEWSSNDPACLVRLIDASIESDGDIAYATKRIGCPEDVSYALQTSGQWDAMWDKRCHFLITQRARVLVLKALAQKVSEDGNAYTFKVLHDTAPKEDLTEDEKRRMAAFSGMTRGELRKEIERHQAVMAGYQERLSAGKAPPPESMKAVIDDVIGPMQPLPTNQDDWEAQQA